MWFSSPDKNYSEFNAGDHRPMKKWKVMVYKGALYTEKYRYKMNIIHTEIVESKYEPDWLFEFNYLCNFVDNLHDHGDYSMSFGDIDVLIEEVV